MNEKIIDIVLKEYEILRSEIDEYHKQQKDFMNFAILIVGGYVSLLSMLYINNKSISFPLLVFPMYISSIGLLYLDRTLRIKRIASYIHNYLRYKLINLVNFHILHWEIYKKVTAKHKEVNYLVSRFLDWFRISVFLLPSLISLVTYFVIKNTFSFSWWEITFLIIDIILIFILIIINLFIEETKGADTELSYLINEIDIQSKSEINRFTN